MVENTQELSAEQITFSIPAEIIHQLRLNGTKDPIIGQARAISALELGLGIKADGYNIFIMGASGTGRRTVLTTLLADYKANPADLQDIAYVYNFSHPLEPKAPVISRRRRNEIPDNDANSHRGDQKTSASNFKIGSFHYGNQENHRYGGY